MANPIRVSSTSHNKKQVENSNADIRQHQMSTREEVEGQIQYNVTQLWYRPTHTSIEQCTPIALENLLLKMAAQRCKVRLAHPQNAQIVW